MARALEQRDGAAGLDGLEDGAGALDVAHRLIARSGLWAGPLCPAPFPCCGLAGQRRPAHNAVCAEHVLGEQYDALVAGEAAACVVHDGHAVAVAVERDAERGALGDDGVPQSGQVLRHGGVGRAVGEGAVGGAEELDDVVAEPMEHARRQVGVGAVPAIEDDAEALAWLGAGAQERDVVVLDGDGLDAAAACGESLVAGDLLDACDVVGRDGQGAEAELQAVLLGGVVGGGDDGEAVGPAPPRGEVDDGRGHRAEVGRVAARGGEAVEQCGAQGRRARPHVAADDDGGRARALAQERAYGPAEVDVERLVELIGVHAADVAGLENAHGVRVGWLATARRPRPV